MAKKKSTSNKSKKKTIKKKKTSSAKANKKTTLKHETSLSASSIMSADSAMPESMTVLVHGTFSNTVGYWYRPGLVNLHRYLSRYVFTDVYSQSDYFWWDAEANDEARKAGAHRLLEWCRRHPAKKYNFVAHSHGCNVVNLATNMGLENINKLVYLAPPVWRHKAGYVPDMSVVNSGFVFNFHAQTDYVVTRYARPPAQQHFGGAIREQRVVLGPVGHFGPVTRFSWRNYDLGSIVRGDFI